MNKIFIWALKNYEENGHGLDLDILICSNHPVLKRVFNELGEVDAEVKGVQFKPTFSIWKRNRDDRY